MKSQALQECITRTDVSGFSLYRGKVRDVYELNDTTLAIVASDRISAFDHILKQAIPYKGQILNQLAHFHFTKVDDIIETHIIDIPHPNITIAKKCDPIPVEVVVRGYLTGHAWRTYKSGKRVLCGVHLDEGLSEHQKLSSPILTPATKATEGHDEDISEKEILERSLVDPTIWEQIRNYAFQLFERGTEVAKANGLILVDTKYEFGIQNGNIILIDEVHTADSSRYFYTDDYSEAMKSGESPKQLSKEFVREWLMGNGFQGLEGQILPDLTDEFRWEVYSRYKDLFEILTGTSFIPISTENFDSELESILKKYN